MKEPVLVIMAAGMGSRFGGMKQITPVDEQGHKIIDFSLYDAWRAGFRKVVFIIKKALEEDFKAAIGTRMERYFDVRYVFQEVDKLPAGFSVPEGRVKPWGTGHAIACAKDAIDGPFAVLNADDYYGAHAISAIYDFLKAPHKPSEHAMVAYMLRNTVTESGYVARGVCTVENGRLQDVVERTHIEKRGNDAAYTEDGEHFVDLPGDTMVSMNLWGFQQEFLEALVEGFPGFLEENLPKNPIKCEYFLPTVANNQLQKGLATVEVIPTPDVWHGVTYAQDLQAVKDAVAELKAGGLYPESLWMNPAAYHFPLEGAPFSVERYGCGHINTTYLLTTTTGRRYILQRIADIFDSDALMKNIEAVTAFAASHTDDPRGAMHLVHTLDGKSYYHAPDGDYRVYDFVEHSICLQAAETPQDFYESAVAFGGFQQLMAQFPAETLTESIPNFHNTIDRYRIFHETLSKDPCGRAAEAEPEIAFALKREQEAGTLQRLRESGELPLRVTHNDTKLNNVMLDEDTRKALCVIDLDTVMPGLAAYDYGDSIRFGAATAAEDEEELYKMTIDLELFRSYTRGFLQACPGLTEKELETLALGAKTMTLECGVRFLTDYLDGDHYFAVHKDKHNLIRCRTQFKLVSEMEAHWEEMLQIVKEEANR